MMEKKIGVTLSMCCLNKYWLYLHVRMPSSLTVLCAQEAYTQNSLENFRVTGTAIASAETRTANIHEVIPNHHSSHM